MCLLLIHFLLLHHCHSQYCKVQDASTGGGSGPLGSNASWSFLVSYFVSMEEAFHLAQEMIMCLTP